MIKLEKWPFVLLVLAATPALVARAQLPYPPVLPGGKSVATDTSDAFLKPTPTLREGVAIAKTPPAVDFMFYPDQDHPGKPWSRLA